MDVLLLLLKVTVLLAAAIAGAWLLRRASAVVRHALWTATFVSVLALPLLSGLVPTIGIPVATEGPLPAPGDVEPAVSVDMGWNTTPSDSSPTGADIPAVGPQVASSPRPAAIVAAVGPATAPRWPRPTLGEVVLGVWLIGFIAALAAMVVALIGVRRVVAAAEEVVNPDWRAALADVSASRGRRPARLLMSPLVAVPMAGGVWRPRIFLPVGARDWPIEQRAVVLAHETAHLAAGDPLRHLVARLALAVYWFHPLAWLAARQASADCEQACDQVVVSGGVLPSTYARVLLKLTDSAGRGRHVLAAQPMASRSGLERRLIAILADEGRRPRRGLALTMAVAVLLTAGAVGPLVPVSVAQPDLEPTLVSDATETLRSSSVPTTPVSQHATAANPGTISGVVLDGYSEAPLADVAVWLTGRDQGKQVVSVQLVTDARGRFVFEDLPAATYQIRASGPGYATRWVGSDGRTSNPYLSLAAGQTVSSVRAWLWPYGSIQGRVVDEHGEPVVRTPVRAIAQITIAGRVRHVVSQDAVTDDRGEYRLLNLPAGSYLVLRSQGHFEASTRRAYPTTYHPGTRESTQAASVALQPGEDRIGVDIRLDPEPVGRIEGHLEGSLGGLVGARLRLVHRGGVDLGLGYEAATAVVRADGTFAFPSVPAGLYRIEALPSTAVMGLGTSTEQSAARKVAAVPYPDMYVAGQSIQSTMRQVALSSTVGDLTVQSYARTVGGWVRSDVEIRGGEVEQVVLQVRPTVSISGRIVYEPGPTADQRMAGPLGVWMTAEPADPSFGLPKNVFSQSVPDAFSIGGLLPGDYYLTYALHAIKSVRWNGREYANLPFDASAGANFTDVVVTLTSRVPTLTGTIRDGKGAPVPFGTVVVFPADTSSWSSFGVVPYRLGAVSADGQGVFHASTLRPFVGLPAGDYLLAAVSGVPSDWMDPAFLEALAPRATKVTVDWGETKAADLRLLDVAGR